MERADLLEANGAIFKPQGEAINAGAADDVKILVVGNPANTNSLIARTHAPDIPAERFTAMTRLDENRAVAQLAQQARRSSVDDIQDLVVWGNHSPTMFPDLFNATVDGEPRRRPGRRLRLVRERVPPAASASAAPRSSRRAARPRRASAANAAIDHVRDWVLGADGLRSMVVPSDGRVRHRGGAQCSLPVRMLRRRATRSSRASRSASSPRRKIDITVNELKGSATPSRSWA